MNCAIGSSTIRRLLWAGLLVGVCALTVWLDRLSHPAPSLPSKPLRVVSMSPHVTEMIFVLGAADCLVGISDYCHLPEGSGPNASAPEPLPRCGGLLNPNFERILALRPNLICLLGRMDRVQQFANDHGIRAVSFNVDSFSDLVREIHHAGDLVDAKAAANRLVRQLEERLSVVRKHGEKLPRYRTLLLLGREPGGLTRMMSVSNASFLGEMLEAAHGENIFALQKQAYFPASRESIVALQPEVIFELREGAQLAAGQEELLRQDWKCEPSLPAVRHNRILVVTNEKITIPGPGMVEVAEFFQEHLQKFAEEDARKK